MTVASIDWISKSRGLTLQVRNFVDGRSKPGVDHRVLEKYGPRDGELLCRFGAGDASDADEAVGSGRRAFRDGRWARLPGQRRTDVLQKFASLIEAHGDELALLESLDTGKPISDARGFDIPACAEIIRFNAEAADKAYGKVYAADHSSLSYEIRRPIGVIAGVVGWNFPLLLAAQKIGPALATGNSLVLKPSELTSLSTARIAELAVEAGVPEGVFNVIHGDGVVGSALAHHRDVDLLSFTGSSKTGKELLVAAGRSNMKRVILECGGKAPNIIFEDSPYLDAIADAVISSAFWNMGQVCVASSRLLVQDDIKEKLLEIVIDKTSALRPGDPLIAETKFGALVTRSHKQKVLDYIESGKNDGARLVHQSSMRPPIDGGFYVNPTIFDQVSSKSKIAQEEIFGPVLSVLSFRSEEEAIRIANETIYGLSAIIWTKDLARAHRMSLAVEAGSVVINATPKPAGGPSVTVLAVGGHKESGIGVEGGLEGLEACTSKTAVQLFV